LTIYQFSDIAEMSVSRTALRLSRKFLRQQNLRSTWELNPIKQINAGISSSSYQSKDKRLFTPGPLLTAYETKAAMQRDLGSRDVEFMDTIKYIRTKMLDVAGISTEEFTMIPLQGSGTFSVEAAIMTMVPKSGGKLLLCVNGSYGMRMIEIAKYSNIDVVVIRGKEENKLNVDEVKKALIADPTITNVAMVHCETSSGVIHPIHEVAEVVREHAPQATFLVDAMSSFGVFPIDMSNIDFLVTSANKCIEGIPGFGIVIARKEKLLQCKGNCRSLSLDIVEQYLGLEKNGQFRFTPPTHAILGFKKAVELWEAEGGVEGRSQRYKQNRSILRVGMKEMGFKEFLSEDHEGYIITSFFFPSDPNFDFVTFYSKLNAMDQVIYPGKVTDADCFRIGNIGDLKPEDMQHLLVCIKKVCGDMNISLPVKC